MRLGDLAAALELPLDGDPSVEVTGVTHQADWARPGDAFVAIRGARVDGHTFISQAIERGAVAVFGEGLPQGTDCPVPYVVVPAARAALADPAILVLDEATSSLDPGTEVLVDAAVERLMAGRTTIVIAHRLSTAARADRVGVVEDGRLVELGTHRELAAVPGGRYAALYDAWTAGLGVAG